MSYTGWRPRHAFDFWIPRGTIDSEQLHYMHNRMYDLEQRRRARTVDDEFRDRILTNTPIGVKSYSDRSIHEPWQKTFYERYGGIINPLNENYVCKHCGMKYGLAIPPSKCVLCGRLTDYGIMERDKAFHR